MGQYNNCVGLGFGQRIFWGKQRDKESVSYFMAHAFIMSLIKNIIEKMVKTV